MEKDMKEIISILKIIESTTVDGPGFRTAIYGAGCQHQCPGCHNPDSWSETAGKLMHVDIVMDRILANEFEDVTFSGGDPFFQVEAFTELAYRIKNVTNKNIWCYTGFRFEEILNIPRFASMLPYIDVLVDGRYIENLRDENALFRGSINQRLIDVQNSLAKNEITTWNYDPLVKYA